MAGLHGAGHVRATSGEVPSLMSNSTIKKLATFNDLGPGKESPSSFASISADLQLADLWISSNAISIDGHGVDVEGSGRVSVSSRSPSSRPPAAKAP
jgi:hypothetical protein